MLVGGNLTRTTGSFGFYHESNPDERTLVNSVREFAEIGIKVIEINVGIAMLYPELVTDKTIKGLLEVKEDFDIEYTIHLPFNYLDASALLEKLRVVAVEELKRLINLFESIKPIHYILHLTKSETNFVANNPRYPSWVIENTIKNMAVQASKSVEELIEIIEPKRLCIENLEYKNNPFPFFDIIKKYNTAMCYDVGHAIKAGFDSVEFFKEHKGFIRHIHFHDIKKEGNKLIDHCGLGEGFVDKGKFLNYIKNSKYDEVFLVEVSSIDQIKQSVSFLKDYNFI